MRVVELAKGKNLVGCKWVFTVKYKSDGSIERYIEECSIG